jgi:hypothetical protein
VLPEITSRAAKYIEERGKNLKEPFFLYLACTGPHTPIVPSKEFQGTTKVGPYGDWVHQVDHSLGHGGLPLLLQKATNSKTLVRT